MNTTKILGEAVGIQYQGVEDRSGTALGSSLTDSVIIGRFKRGIVDKAMLINQSNLRGMLGYDPANPDYIAVQACLDMGVPSVQVIRVGDAA